ncbi:50S ribosomal protein L23 [Candidatus Gracilibacteria bacterium CG17_big_fil_post_rev_8_21_14_2_50_48_13]|nr:MAG: 50S ribosomal protein L23 [Candidatus Gracilibacteria bacterium CG17_big_fil_post_rev_8_21_14_2_50_48_13]
MKTINLRPYLTEKSTQQEAKGFYTFRVPFDTTKIDVKNAIEQQFGKEFAVDTVRMARVNSKVRIVGRGRTLTKRPRFKKAIVSLKDKEKILDLSSKA